MRGLILLLLWVLFFSSCEQGETMEYAVSNSGSRGMILVNGFSTIHSYDLQALENELRTKQGFNLEFDSNSKPFAIHFTQRRKDLDLAETTERLVKTIQRLTGTKLRKVSPEQIGLPTKDSNTISIIELKAQ
jgi:hypothetical protein